jgi:hypothetical protein
VYQDAFQEGRQEGEVSLVLRQLTRRMGAMVSDRPLAIAPETETQIRALSLPQLEALGEALMDFAKGSDLTTWLQTHCGSL